MVLTVLRPGCYVDICIAQSTEMASVRLPFRLRITGGLVVTLARYR
jgi:hypothetical protein